jgi:hypothetical protein
MPGHVAFLFQCGEHQFERAGLAAPRGSTVQNWTATANAAFFARILSGSSIERAITVLANPMTPPGHEVPLKDLVPRSLNFSLY